MSMSFVSFFASLLALLLALLLAFSSLKLSADEAALEQVVIIGVKDEARYLPGSAAVIDSQQLGIEQITDVQQALKTVPGIYIREEEGSGLRPNIGIRGATSERSSNITVLEDGILVAPAPYSAPAAYYFPSAMRMHAIEVLKGAPLLRYGPQTTGGVLNLVSTPIPETNSGMATFSASSFGGQDLHAYYGGGEQQWSWLLETVQRNGEGFKEIDRSNRDSGFDISDYVFKLGWQSVEGPKQKALLKLQQSEEVSNETYLGLTDNDFNKDPNRRYALSSIDQMTNDHQGVSLSYSRELNAQLTVSTMLYRNEFARDWFKLDGGSVFIGAANAGDANAQAVLDGTADVSGLRYKHNNREHLSQGVEVNVDVQHALHLFQIGARLHEDEVDRFQIVENYDQVNGSLVFQSLTQPGSSDNRVGGSDAQTFWIQDNWQPTDELNVVISLRYEDVASIEKRYAVLDRSAVDTSAKNESSELLPGVSFTYDINTQWQVLAGMHKGFSPLGAGATANQSPETSRNAEFGLRFRADSLFVEAIAFHSDFSNKVENCAVGTPCSDGATSGTFKTGEAVISGLEAQMVTQFESGQFTLPLVLAYTYTDAAISADNTVSGVQKGDRLKDVPETVYSIRSGLEHNSGWNNYVVMKYIDETCVAVGCNRNPGPQTETDALLVVDYISHYPLKEGASVFFKAENIFDTQEIISHDPDGARPNKPRTFSLGMKVAL